MEFQEPLLHIVCNIGSIDDLLFRILKIVDFPFQTKYQNTSIIFMFSIIFFFFFTFTLLISLYFFDPIVSVSIIYMLKKTYISETYKTLYIVGSILDTYLTSFIQEQAYKNEFCICFCITAP